jgi:alpha-galactosidase
MKRYQIHCGPSFRSTGPELMAYAQYKAHFSLWAALKSPLMLGNDLRIMTPSALTIVNNPAIIALSQDPLGRSIVRVRRDREGVPKDEYGAAEAHVWSGKLANGDQCVIFVNFGGKDLKMSASLAEIFVSSGPGGSAPQVKSAWDVHDLWADRMGEDTALEIMNAGNGEERERAFEKAGWYNATETPYSIGLEQGDPRLFGKKVFTVKAKGALTTNVPTHAARVYRLRKVTEKTGRDEL